MIEVFLVDIVTPVALIQNVTIDGNAKTGTCTYQKTTKQVENGITNYLNDGDPKTCPIDEAGVNLLTVGSNVQTGDYFTALIRAWEVDH